MPIERKTFQSEVKSFNDEELTIDHFISTVTQDEGGDIMEPEGMEIRGKTVVLFQHGLDPVKGMEPIAKPINISIGVNSKGIKGIIVRTKYYDGSKLVPPDNTGRRLYEKAKLGFMPNWSIGWEPVEYQPTANNGRHVTKWKLLEYSQVAVGMNDEATTDIKNYAGIKYERCIDGCTDCKGCMEKGEIITDLKPYPNEHACRLREPVANAKTRRVNGDREHEGKKYDVIYQQQDGKWVEQAYRYPKETWTVSQASAHCKSHKGIHFEPASEKIQPVGEVKGVIPFAAHSLASLDTPWNASSEVGPADVSDLKIMCAWYDESKPDVKSSYKLPHHTHSDYKTVWNGVKAAMGAILGARGGIDMPEGDRKGTYNHIAKHYKEFEKEPPELKTCSEEELKVLGLVENLPKEPAPWIKSIAEQIVGTLPMNAINIITSAMINELVTQTFAEPDKDPTAIANDILSEYIGLVISHLIGFVIECRAKPERKGKTYEEIKNEEQEPPKSNPVLSEPVLVLELKQPEMFELPVSIDKFKSLMQETFVDATDAIVQREIRKRQGKLD